MRFYLIILIFTFALLSCAGEQTPATPLETFKAYTKAIKQKDPAAMKLLLSDGSMKMHEQEAKAQNVQVDEIVKRETIFSENQTSVEFRNEKVEGDRATLEVKNSFGAWETVPFIKEDGAWKIDKQGYADQIMREVEQKQNEAFDQSKPQP